MIERIVIFTAREDQRLPQMCVTSVRYHHPAAEIIHITDQATPQLNGSDAVWRGKWDGNRDAVPMLRARQVAQHIDNRPTLLLDSDILVCAPLDDVFEEKFDVALTWRLSKISRYNAGVMFSRRAKFWHKFLALMVRKPSYQTWNNEQVALDRTAESWKVLELPCSLWNHSPELGTEVPPPSKVLHYKGPRKEMMAAHFAGDYWRR